MPELSPMARFAVLFLAGSAVAVSTTAWALAAPYGFTLVLLASSGALDRHLRFVLVVTTPLLIALLVVWGLILHTAPTGERGTTYALMTWLRVAAFGAVAQWFFVPLADRPAALRGFLHRLRAPSDLSALLITPLIFIPEVQRRLARAADARRAQGHRISGLHGLTALPALLMPVVASLVESALSRAELWDHRGYLTRPWEDDTPSTGRFKTGLVVLMAGATLLAASAVRLAWA